MIFKFRPWRGVACEGVHSMYFCRFAGFAMTSWKAALTVGSVKASRAPPSRSDCMGSRRTDWWFRAPYSAGSSVQSTYAATSHY